MAARERWLSLTDLRGGTQPARHHHAGRAGGPVNRAFTVVFKGRNGRGRTSRLRGPSGPGAQELPQPSGTLPGWLGQGEGPECERPVEEGRRELCRAAVHLCSWLHPCPFLGISSPWQGSPSSACETPMPEHQTPGTAEGTQLGSGHRLAPPPASLSPPTPSLAGAASP